MSVPLGSTSLPVQEIVRGPSGDIWVLADRSVYRISHGTARRADIGLSDSVTSLAPTPAGMFFGTAAGLFWLDEMGGATAAVVVHQKPVSWAAVGTEDLWFGSPRQPAAIFRFQLNTDGRPKKPAQFSPLEYGSVGRIRRVIVPHTRKLLALDPDFHVVVLPRDASSAVQRLPLNYDEAFQSAAITGGSPYLLTSKRLLRIQAEGAIQSSSNEADGIAIAPAYREGMWILRHGSAKLFDPRKKEVTLAQIALPSRLRPTAIAEDSVGRLWLGTETGLFMAVRSPGASVALTADTGGLEDPLTPNVNPMLDGRNPPLYFGVSGEVWRIANASVTSALSNGNDLCTFEEPPDSLSFSPALLAVFGTSLRRLENCRVGRPIELVSDTARLDRDLLELLDVDDALLRLIEPNAALMKKLQEAAKSGESLNVMEIGDRLAKFLIQHVDGQPEEAELARIVRGSRNFRILSQTAHAVLLRSSTTRDSSMYAVFLNDGKAQPAVRELPFTLPGSRVRPPAGAGGIAFAMADGNSIAEIGADLRIRVWQAPRDSQPAYMAATRRWEVHTASGRSFLTSSKSIWHLIPGVGPKEHLQAAESVERANVLGILPEPGGSILLGCWHCATEPKSSVTSGAILPEPQAKPGGENSNLFRLTADGNLWPLPLTADKVGCGKNALLRDSKGRVWLSTQEALFVSDSDLARFEAVSDGKNRLNKHFNALLEMPPGSGQIWGLAPRDGLWRLDEMPRLVATAKNAVAAFAAGAARGAAKATFWLGGEKSLVVLDADTGALVQDLSAAILGAVPEMESVEAVLTSDREVLVATDRGLLRLKDAAGEPERIERWPKCRDAGFVTLADGSVLLYVDAENRTAIWKYMGGALEAQGSVRYAVASATAHPKGGALLGTMTGQLLHWQGKKSQLIATVGGATRWSTLRAFCPLRGETGVIASDAGLLATNLAKHGSAAELAGPVLDGWRSCAPLSDSEALLLQSEDDADRLADDFSDDEAGDEAFAEFENAAANDGRLLRLKVDVQRRRFSFAPVPCGKTQGCPEQFEQLAVSPSFPGRAWLLDGTTVWLFANDELKPLTHLPPKVRGRVSLSIDPGGLWLATEQFGAWRWAHDPTRASRPGVASWHSYDDGDGLPSTSIRNIIPRSESEAAILTSAGVCLARKNGDKWVFDPPRQDGIVGSLLRKAELFDLDERTVIAVLTEEGMSLGAAKHGSPDLAWTPLDTAMSSDYHKLRTFAWCSGRSELWVAHDNRLLTYKLNPPGPSNAPIRIEKRAALSPVFPAAIRDLRISVDCNDAWAVTAAENGNSGVTRWTRRDRGSDANDGEIVSTQPLFFSTGMVSLTPAHYSTTPEVLHGDEHAGYSLWKLPPLAEPQFELKDYFLWIGGQVAQANLASSSDNGALTLSIGVDGRAQGTKSWVWAPDLLQHRPYSIVATVSDALGREWTFVARRHADFGVWLLRLGLLALMFAGTALVFIRQTLRAIVRRRRLRANEIPYVYGKAVEGEGFIGREDLLNTLRDSVANNSFALLGEWRIGKSSIQKRLASILRETNSPGYVYFPVWVDLQYVFDPNGPGEEGFFRYLVQRMIAETRHDVDESVIVDLNLSQTENAQDYTSTELEQDIQTLRDYWKNKHAPRTPIVLFQIDEAGLMYKLDYNALLAFRAIFVNLQGVHTILSGKSIPPDAPGDLMSPWANSIKKIEVGPLPYTEARRLVEEPAKSLFRFEEPAVEHIIALAENKPMKIQELCADVLKYKYRQGHLRRRITKIDVDEARTWLQSLSTSTPQSAAPPADIESEAIDKARGASSASGQ
jgi:ligand-binding sensor domain-containing protein